MTCQGEAACPGGVVNLGGVANLGGAACPGGAQKGLFIAAFHEIEDKFVSGFKFENKSLSNSKPKHSISCKDAM